MNDTLAIFEYRDFLIKRYGQVLHRIPLDLDFSCPNRNIDGTGGCSFCSERGARATQLGEIQELRSQIKAGVNFARQRYDAKGFMAYLQAFTSTFASVDRLDSLVKLICAEENFEAIIFGTRPDCLPAQVISYLKTLQHNLDVWVELGVQTIHDRTLLRINRGHDYQTSREAIIKLHEAGISVAIHLILGLPGETLEDFHQTIKAVAALPISAIKLHNLHILKDTTLAQEYQAEPFPLFNEHEYAEILCKLLPIIPAEIPIIRLTTDSQQEQLLAPKWSMGKGQFRNHLKKLMHNRGISQGMHLRKNTIPTIAHVRDTLEPVPTDDGSITFWNNTLKEHYHSQAGARSEADQKYCLPAQLTKRLAQGKVRILDICFGLGYNSLSSCEHALKALKPLEITALELDKNVVQMAAQTVTESDNILNWNNCLQALYSHGQWNMSNCSIDLLWGDARHTITKLSGEFDLIWLDAFSTQRNSELWTVDFFSNLLPLLAPSGVLCTYCAAIPVRSGLLEAGFYVGETEPFGRQRGGTIGSKAPELISRPLPDRDMFLISSTRGTPYRDPNGTRSNKEILRARESEILTRKNLGAPISLNK